MKVRYRLKKEIKLLLALISMLVIVIGLLYVNYRITKDSINQCVESGLEYNYCKNGLM